MKLPTDTSPPPSPQEPLYIKTSFSTYIQSRTQPPSTEEEGLLYIEWLWDSSTLRLVVAWHSIIIVDTLYDIVAVARGVRKAVLHVRDACKSGQTCALSHEKLHSHSTWSRPKSVAITGQSLQDYYRPTNQLSATGIFGCFSLQTMHAVAYFLTPNGTPPLLDARHHIPALPIIASIFYER